MSVSAADTPSRYAPSEVDVDIMAGSMKDKTRVDCISHVEEVIVAAL